jgi:acyl-CoA thioesterase
MAHAFDEAVALVPQGEGVWEGRTHPAWANMIGPFGGITAAQVLAGVMQHPQRLGDPVAFTVNFCAAVADGPFTVHAKPSRTNRSTQHWSIELRQAGEAVVTATAVTALRRQTWGVQESAMPQAPRPEDIRPAPRGKRVEWINRYDLRFIEGGYPQAWDGAQSPDSRTRMWMRDEPARPLDYLSLTALCDVYFPRIWRRRATFVPIGTVTMTVYFHAQAGQLQDTADGWLLGQAQASNFGAGYFDQAAQVWSEAGILLATTHQVVYYKE